MANRRAIHDDPSLNAGIRALTRHDPRSALRYLRESVDSCPVSRRTDLATRLYWLSVALQRLGKDGLALKALASARMLAPRGFARARYEGLANQYGMPRSSCADSDDYRAFAAIHIRRYLSRRASMAFMDEAEAIGIFRAVADAWARLESSFDRSSATCDEKLEAFRRCRIDYPVRADYGAPSAVGRKLTVNFRSGTLFSADERCLCGSGLPFSRCCGRVRMPYEKEFG